MCTNFYTHFNPFSLLILLSIIYPDILTIFKNNGGIRFSGVLCAIEILTITSVHLDGILPFITCYDIARSDETDVLLCDTVQVHMANGL